MTLSYDEKRRGKRFRHNENGDGKPPHGKSKQKTYSEPSSSNGGDPDEERKGEHDQKKSQSLGPKAKSHRSVPGRDTDSDSDGSFGHLSSTLSKLLDQSRGQSDFDCNDAERCKKRGRSKFRIESPSSELCGDYRKNTSKYQR